MQICSPFFMASLPLFPDHSPNPQRDSPSIIQQQNSLASIDTTTIHLKQFRSADQQHTVQKYRFIGKEL